MSRALEDHQLLRARRPLVLVADLHEPGSPARAGIVPARDEQLPPLHPLGLKTFHNTVEKAQATAVLAANQGLYNGFLAAGLVWGLLAAAPYAAWLKMFFLGCVVVAGLGGAMTVSQRILIVQALPAAIALALVLMSR